MVAVPVAVEADCVPGADDLGRQGGRALHLLAYQKERGGRPRVGQRRQHCRRALRVRTVVEGERHRGAVVAPCASEAEE